jgi:methylated-DNA-[protein]-cysteine S-methyltransferase
VTVTRTVPSPLGPLLLVGDGHRLGGLFLGGERRPPALGQGVEDGSAFADAAVQLDEWFAGRRQVFELDLAAEGSPFQQPVWTALLEIPYGETVTYGEVAARVGRPGSARAVGRAVGRNPIGIVVPCHRVVAAGGALGGYAGGLDAKRWLLAHEQRVTHRDGRRS